MKIEIFPSLSGDCLLITSADGKRLLADGGLPEAYEQFIAAPLAKLRKAGTPIDIAYVSHVDQDHIGGILRLLDHEVKWRVFDKAANPRLQPPKVPRPPEIKEIWHNAFLETVATTRNVDLGAALADSANMLAGLNAGSFGNLKTAKEVAEIEMLALSVGEAIEVNWRISKDQLNIPLNTPAGGDFMTASLAGPVLLGSLSIRVIGPTKSELEELRDFWIEWLEDRPTRVETLRRRHQKDVDRLASAVSPGELATLSHELASAVEKDVTPPNLASLVLLVEEAGKTLFLTGDAGDKSLLRYLEAAGMVGRDKRLFVDVLKVPHHGAENSYSPEFADKVRAEHYVFCGDGEHHNPEPDVVRGYLEAVAARPLGGGRKARFWFNCSEERAAPEHQPLWHTVEAMVDTADPNLVARHSIGVSDDRLAIDL